MTFYKRWLHDAAIGTTRLAARLLPDRVPVTFVGAGATGELCESLAQAAPRRVLVVTDAGLIEAGIVARVERLLEAAGVPYSVYSGVLPDPTFAQVAAGLEALRSQDCDAVLALGGGSPLDAAKMIAAGATSDRPLEKLEGMFKLRQAPLPIYAVPTTAGTGSEATVAAVVSDDQTHTKKFFVDPKLLPQMAALDPTLMTGLPTPITAATGMDALTHALESWLARTATPQTEAWARSAVRLIFRHLPTACEQGEDLGARKAMALASYYAGLAFTRTSVGYVHAIAHSLGARYGTPHGLANAIALPHVLEFSRPAIEGRLAALAELLGIQEGGEGEKAAAFIEAVRELQARIGIPARLETLKPADIPELAAQAVTEAHAHYPVPRYMSQSECESLLRAVTA